ncbi:MAG TPA: glycosyltransferase family 1 protein [Nitrospirae bacterium]|nr:putative glycosyltransferase EpsD [bacterium BMS3Abin10]GBE39940.1 putative glycosyltransferase EpsD [bacterium BMS3Bbin08]HDK81975.1 glycosyltransferase family 1 protein [Nitrospirota bacterium]
MPKAKILRIIARLNIGGPAIHVILLADELDRLGYETVLVKGSEGAAEGNMMDLAEAKGIKPVVIPELGREIGIKNDLKAFYKLYRLIRKEKPDIVHTHTAKAGTLGRIAARLAGVPVILHTFHGHVLTGYFGRCRSWVFILIEKILALITTRLITLSEELKRELIDMGIGKEDKFEVIPLGLELEPFLDAERHKGRFKNELGLSAETAVIGIVGRLVPIKGHRLFLEMAKIIDSQADIKFVIVGDGELRKELEDYAEKLGIADEVIFTGFRRDLPEIYAGLDIVVLTSKNEGTPVSIIEAMAAARPVVATNVGGVPSLVKDGVTGLLVKPGDTDSLSDAVARLIKDPHLRQDMGREARSRVFPSYDISELVGRINVLYSSLRDKKQGS